MEHQFKLCNQNPYTVKNSSMDYIMFHRQSVNNVVVENDQSLFPVQVYSDGHSLFRSVAARLDQHLLVCSRKIGGVPLDPRLFETEKKLADLLREKTVSILKENLHFSSSWIQLFWVQYVKKKKGVTIVVFWIDLKTW